MTQEAIRLTRDGPVATITLDRPQQGNALHRDGALALLSAAIRCDDDATVRAVVLTGAGRLFCGGGDVRFFAAAGDDGDRLLRETIAFLHAAISRLLRMAKPLVVAVNGPAAGAGLGLAMIGDVVLAAPEATFSTAYAGLGLSPDGGVSWLLPRMVGYRVAQDLLLSGRKVPAEEAVRLGMVTRLVDGERLAVEAAAVAATLATLAPAAVAATRALLLAAGGQTLETHLEDEARSIMTCARARAEMMP